MKNSNEPVSFFDNLPTADEAERMEASVSEASCGEYNETAVTNLALAGMQAERNSTAKQASETKSRKRRKSLRTVLVAAILAVVLLTSLCAAAALIYDVRLTDLLGITRSNKDLDNGYFKIGLSKTWNGLTVTLVDSIGDCNTQWIEVKTSRKLPEGTPDGWLWMIDSLSQDEFVSCRLTDFDVKFFDASLVKKSLPDLDLYYNETLRHIQGASRSAGGGGGPFCRDGYLWYLIRVSTHERSDLNHGLVHMALSIRNDLGQPTRFEFNWCNNYDAREKTVTVDRTVGDVTVSEITLSPTGIYLHYLGNRDRARVISITLANGTVLDTMDIDHITEENKMYYGYAAQETPFWDGWTEEFVVDEFGYFSSRFYSLLPNVSFQTGSAVEGLISIDDIVSINVNGFDISLR